MEFTPLYGLYPKNNSWSYPTGSTAIDQEKTKAGNVVFHPGVIGYKLETSNAHYSMIVFVNPSITLLGTSTVRDFINKDTNKNLFALRNTAKGKLYRGIDTSEEDKLITGHNSVGTDYAGQMQKTGKITKTLVSSTSNALSKRVQVTWRLDASEYNETSKEYIRQSSGVLYDLLPVGASFVAGSEKVLADGARLKSGTYTLDVTDNYNNSGRTMVTIRIKKEAKNYRAELTTSHPWDVVTDFGKKLLNTAAYETGNDSIGEGSNDDGGSVTEKALMTNLDPDTDAAKFVYTEIRSAISFPVSSSLGLTGTVKAEKDADYKSETNTNQSGTYSYRLRFSSSNDKVKDLVLYDTLENYKTSDGNTSKWRGTLQNIDLSQVESLGIQPVVYYSTSAELANYDATKSKFNGDLTSSDWTTEKPDTSKITAIAIDLRKTSAGDEYVLPANTGATVTLYMKAPDSDNSGDTDPRAYNNVFLYNTLLGDNETELTSTIHNDFTTVHYRVTGDLNLTKVDKETDNPIEGITFTLTGTSDYSTAVNMSRTSAQDGTLSFTDVEKGSYTLTETGTSDDYLALDAALKVTIDKDGKVTLTQRDNDTGEYNELQLDSDDQTYHIENTPRIHGDLTLVKYGYTDRNKAQANWKAGAEFKLSGKSDYGNDILMYATSADNGLISFPDVEKGVYRLVETKAPEGYILPKDTVYTVICDANGNVGISGGTLDKTTGYYRIDNEPYHHLTIFKQSDYDKTAVAGAKFTLTGTSDYGTEVNLEGTTDESGFYNFTPLEPGTYVLQETSAPDGYRLDTSKHVIVIDEEGKWHSDEFSDDGAGNLVFYDIKVPTEKIVVTKKWNDGLTGDNAKNRPYPVINIASYDPSAEDTSSSSNSGTGITTEETTNSETAAASPMTVLKSAAKAIRKAVSGLFGTKVEAAETGNIASGTWGTCPWTIDSEGVMTIGSGSSASISYGYTQPWADWKTKIKRIDASANIKIEGDGNYIFTGLTNLESIDISGLDTSKATSLRSLFSGCSKLTTIDLSKLDTSNAYTMAYMFNDCSELQSIDLSGFKTTVVTDTSYMFQNCASLKSIDCSSFSTSNVTTMVNMFSGCSELTELNISTFDTSNVSRIMGMFSSCSQVHICV